jgi:hypothetical protein
MTSNPEVIHLAEKRAICRSAVPRMVVQIEGVLVLGPTFQSAGSYGVSKRAWNGTNLFVLALPKSWQIVGKWLFERGSGKRQK